MGFGANGDVLMNDRTTKKVCNIKKNDILDKGAKVICIVKRFTNESTVISKNDLNISGFHPIFYHFEWHLPIWDCKLDKNKNIIYVDNECVYNFVLDSRHVININGVTTCTLGHNYTYDDIVKHDFYGTEKVIDDLETFTSYKRGIVNLYDINIHRDSNDKICRYRDSNFNSDYDDDSAYSS